MPEDNKEINPQIAPEFSTPDDRGELNNSTEEFHEISHVSENPETHSEEIETKSHVESDHETNQEEEDKPQYVGSTFVDAGHFDVPASVEEANIDPKFADAKNKEIENLLGILNDSSGKFDPFSLSNEANLLPENSPPK